MTDRVAATYRAVMVTLLMAQKIDPLVKRTFPLLDAAKALELLAAGSVEGKIVLTND